MNKNIPEGWVGTKIEHVCTSPQYGWTTSAQKDGNLHLLRTTDITTKHVDWNSVPYCKNEPKDIAKYLLHDGDIVISRAGSVGFSYLINKPKKSIFASYLIRFKPLINKHFFAYFLNSDLYWKEISNRSVGIALANVNATKLKQIPIPVPPLNEQHRIVAKIESIFAQIDACKKNLECLVSQSSSSQGSLAQLRSRVLKQAFEGKLVPQDSDDEPAEMLLKSPHPDNKVLGFEKEGLPERWLHVPLSLISRINPKLEKNSIEKDLEITFVPMRCVKELSGEIDLSITKPYGEVKKGYTFFENGDIIFAKITPCMENGKIAVIRGLKNGIGLGSTEFHVIRLHSNISRKFYFYYLTQDRFRKKAQSKMKGTAGQLRVPVDFLQQELVPVPPLLEQHRIVSKMELIFTKIDTINTYIKSTLRLLDMLKSSTLKQAFEGKLVPQDPNDEPAASLLEQIQYRSAKNV